MSINKRMGATLHTYTEHEMNKLDLSVLIVIYLRNNVE